MLVRRKARGCGVRVGGLRVVDVVDVIDRRHERVAMRTAAIRGQTGRNRCRRHAVRRGQRTGSQRVGHVVLTSGGKLLDLEEVLAATVDEPTVTHAPLSGFGYA